MRPTVPCIRSCLAIIASLASSMLAHAQQEPDWSLCPEGTDVQYCPPGYGEGWAERNNNRTCSFPCNSGVLYHDYCDLKTARWFTRRSAAYEALCANSSGAAKSKNGTQLSKSEQEERMRRARVQEQIDRDLPRIREEARRAQEEALAAQRAKREAASGRTPEQAQFSTAFGALGRIARAGGDQESLEREYQRAPAYRDLLEEYAERLAKGERASSLKREYQMKVTHRARPRADAVPPVSQTEAQSR